MERFWSRAIAGRNGTPPASDDSSAWQQDTTMLRGLNLGLHETLAYLYGMGPSLERFEEWILEKNAGAIASERIEAIISALRGDAVATNDTLDRVLSDDDLSFFDEHGYVVLHDAVSPEQVRAAVDAVCGLSGVDLDEPGTWYRAGRRDPWIPEVHHPAFDANRNAPRVRAAFAQLWKRDDLWAALGQCQVNVPEKPGWQYSGDTLHWDVSLAAPIPFGLDGLLYLTDTEADQGAFTCVPGFHKVIDSWLTSLPHEVDPRRVNLYEMGAYSVPGKAGDLIVWHQAIPHSGSPNRACLPRIVQAINLRPSSWEQQTEWK